MKQQQKPKGRPGNKSDELLKGGKTFENKEKLKERGYKWTGDSWGKNTGSLPDSIQELRFIRDKF